MYLKSNLVYFILVLQAEYFTSGRDVKRHFKDITDIGDSEVAKQILARILVSPPTGLRYIRVICHYQSSLTGFSAPCMSY